MKTPFQVFTGLVVLSALALTACGGVSDADAVQTIVAGTMSAHLETQPVQATPTVGPIVEPAPGAEALPSPEAAAAQPAGPETNVTFEDTSFYLDYQLASSWTFEITTPPDPTSDNPFQAPSMYRLDFQGFLGANPDESRAWRQPRLYVIPVANMGSFPGGGYGLNALGYYDGLLDFKPPAVEQPMPVLPYSLNFDNGEVYHGKLAYLDFQNGSGVRFLAEYSQAPFPLGKALAYIFQGVTDDGQYYVSLALPLDQTALDEYNAPYNSSLEAGAWEAFAENIESYMQGASAILESTPDSGFTPDLARLDEMVRSLNVRP
jgi:hypothetical protein